MGNIITSWWKNCFINAMCSISLIKDELFSDILLISDAVPIHCFWITTILYSKLFWICSKHLKLVLLHTECHSFILLSQYILFITDAQVLRKFL
jgi:hypothetical protein